MSIQTSVQDGQSVFNNQMIPPLGVNLSNAVTSTLSPTNGAIAYSINETSLFLGDGTDWIKLHTDASSLAIGAPIAATDGNVLTIGAGILKAEIADQTHNGIVSVVAQSFGGVKNFALDGIVVQGPGFVTAGLNTLFQKYCKVQRTVTWTGGITPDVVSTILLERIGDIIFLTLTLLNPSTQANGLISSTTAVLDAEFRPSSDATVSCQVINAGMGSTPTDGVAQGNCRILTTGIIQIGLGLSNTNIIAAFSNGHVAGHGNGFMDQTLVFKA